MPAVSAIRTIITLILLSLASSSHATLEVEAADKVLVEKSKRKLHLLRNNEIIKSYEISLGKDPVGDKTQQGDMKTPEGQYVIDYRNSNSKFYKSLHISYPGPEDIAQAKSLGVTPGGDIMIHGLQNGYDFIGERHRRYDWTEGCIAVTNQEMDEIWLAVNNGTPIEIKP